MNNPQVLPVVVDAPQHAGLSQTLDYASEQALAPGSLVQVPLGRRSVPGLVWDRRLGDAAGTDQLRPVQAAMTGLPPLGAAWMRLVEFCARYYQRSLGEVALSVLPPELRRLDDTQLARRLERLRKLPPLPDAPPPVLPALTDEQAAALGALAAQAPGTTLLQGVTGSGKTEVYLRCAAQALQQGRQVLVLVPEINLTPQLEARFVARFGAAAVTALHSGMTQPQRLKSWLAAHFGAARILLGTRMAVFASLPAL